MLTYKFDEICSTTFNNCGLKCPINPHIDAPRYRPIPYIGACSYIRLLGHKSDTASRISTSCFLFEAILLYQLTKRILWTYNSILIRYYKREVLNCEVSSIVIFYSNPFVCFFCLLLALSQCEKERKLSFSPFLNGDTFSPECNANGSFKTRQCFTHLYFGKQCWCVDKNGQEILGTRRVDGSHPDCHKGKRLIIFKWSKKF